LNGNSKIRDISELAQLKRLEELYLTGCTGLTDLEPLAEIPSLKVPVLDGCVGISDFSVLGDLRELRTLSVNGCHIDDLGDCTALPHLLTLRADVRGGIRVVPDLGQMRLLRRLVLRLDAGVELPVDRLPTQLRELHLLGRDWIADFAAAVRLPQLRLIEIENAFDLRDVDFLGDSQWLESITMRGCERLADCDALTVAHRLRLLDLSGSMIESMSFCQAMLQLEDVRLDRCFRLSDLAGLTYSRRLRSVSLQGATTGLGYREVERLESESQSRFRLLIDFDPFDPGRQVAS
jgi:internalin A